MSALFSKPCQYAITAMTYLAARPADELLSIRDLSECSEVPQPFLSKIMSSLARHGLVTSRRGPNGGVALRGAPEDVLVGDIVDAIDGPLSNKSCVLGFDDCDDDAPCPLHDAWKSARSSLMSTLHRKTLADLTTARRTRPGRKARTRRRPTVETRDERKKRA